ncbi:MAG: ABC transporter permease [bacterium]|nr:ABC transporter permease [bacterium]
MKAQYFIALRYLFAKKKRNAINVISGIAMLAFAVCTAALIIILSTMNGFEELIFSMYNKFNPEIKITLSEGKVFEERWVQNKLKNIQGIQFISPVLEDNAVIRNRDYQTVCTIKGVDSAYFMKTGMKSQITEGQALISKNNINYVILGAGISQKVNANINGPFSLLSFITPKRGDYSVSDPDAINQMEIEPSGVITMDETVNNRYVYVPIGFARELFERPNMLTSIELKLKDPNAVESTIEKLEETLGAKYKVQNRMQQQASLYKMFKSEKWASYAILTFILLIAAFNALGSLTMLVIEKQGDIKTLTGMGASHAFIRTIFFSNGVLIALIGCLIGLFFGIGLVWAQQEYGFVKLTGAIVESYPVKLILNDVLLVSGTALGLGLLTGIYPALKSVKGVN